MRIDAMDKVLGRKIYARDLRAGDIKALTDHQEDWGNVTLHALLLRSSYLNRAFIDLNLMEINRYAPIKCFTRHGDLFKNRLDPAEDYELDFGFGLFGATPEVDLFVDQGQSAQYVGQPLALLLFDDIAKFLNAEREQLGVRNLVNYGPLSTEMPSAYEQTNPISGALDDWLEFGANPPGEKLFGGQGVDVGEREDSKYPTIERSFNEGTVLELRSSTPTIDPCYLEPDACLGKVVPIGEGKVDLVMYAPTQSPISDEGAINASLKRNITGSKIDLRTLQLGGGFGGRDFSIFPIYGAIAALVGQGTPVRLCMDRYAQFLSATKRHASVFHTRMAYDSQDGRLLAVQSKLILDGGSQKDLSTSVKGLAQHSSAGCYQFDHWDVRSLAMNNTGPLSGSMRGFGIPQVLCNVEQAIDQIANNQDEDPIQFRMDKVLVTGDLDVDKQILYHDLRNKELCESALAHPLWQQRASEQQSRGPDKLYGVGFALAMEAYGTTKDGASVCITLRDDHKIVFTTEVIEMGQGATTGLAQVFLPYFNRIPDIIEDGEVEQLVRPVKSKPKAEVYSKAGTTAASKSMFFHGHIIDSLMTLWFQRVWIPAAAGIWGIPAENISLEDFKFDEDRQLTVPGQSPISWQAICSAVLATDKSRVWGHGSFHGVWSWSKFQDELGEFSAWLDAISFLPNAKWPGSRDLLEVLERVQPDDARYGSDKAPRKTKRSVYASGAWMIALEVDSQSGEVQLEDAVFFLDAGDRANDELVKGQVEGGLAQGIGMALTEKLPQGALGGQRLYNFHEYALPRLSHMPVNTIQTQFIDLPTDKSILNPIGDQDPDIPPRIRKKGIAEISITPVLPAISNALFHALKPLPNGGRIETRLSDYPISSTAVRAAIEEASA